MSKHEEKEVEQIAHGVPGSSHSNGTRVPSILLLIPDLLHAAKLYTSVRTLQSPIPPHVAKENDPRHQQIHDLFTAISPDLQGTNAWRYQRQISSGIQEYIEAISFQHYLATQTLLMYDEAQKMIPGNIPLTEDDYLLGLFDLTGELMRFAITTIATSGALPRGTEARRDVLEDLRVLRMQFERLDTSAAHGTGSPLKREVEKKMEVMRTSVEKVEAAVYGMIIRGRERPKGWIPELEGAGKREVESH